MSGDEDDLYWGDSGTRKTFVYIAGPYHGQSYHDIDANIGEARRWAAKLAEAGIPFFCPHLNSAHFEVITPDVPPDYWLDAGIAILQSASAVLLLAGWDGSRGSQMEKDRAVEFSIPIYKWVQFYKLVEDWHGKQ